MEAGVGASGGAYADDDPFWGQRVGCDLTVEDHVGKHADDVVDGARDGCAARLAVCKPVNRAAVNSSLHLPSGREPRAAVRSFARNRTAKLVAVNGSATRRPPAVAQARVTGEGLLWTARKVSPLKRAVVVVPSLWPSSTRLHAVCDDAEGDVELRCCEDKRGVGCLVCGTDAVVCDNDECGLLAAAKRRKRRTGERVG